ncbi:MULTISPECIES: twin-arginine translocase TatA/TatE family subunit [Microbacterium]|uniref:twin-arginine translocase TatA/TatE family subunit n=1 Tax=Microbacterium TaxID=33882 RepID=UPI0012B858E0|nr:MULTISPECIES: twin-arginine translocase TatA/TatE family subunit [Microbacterium]MTE23650.1 twin-arginine translocase TatA/TatE family subunit [Microbacterium sp. ZXX196]NHI16798.1 twin-arginine translocase TatA/TatE family subunit [Microbacterium excoecariae]
MPFGNAGIWQILLILVIVLLIFGASRLPALAKSLGQSARAFKGEMKQMKDEGQQDQRPADAADTSGSAPSEAPRPSDSSPDVKP